MRNVLGALSVTMVLARALFVGTFSRGPMQFSGWNWLFDSWNVFGPSCGTSSEPAHCPATPGSCSCFGD